MLNIPIKEGVAALRPVAYKRKDAGYVDNPIVGKTNTNDQAAADLGIISGPVPALITLLAPIALLAYTRSRQRHAEILRDLEERRYTLASNAGTST
jgi:Na+/melibiose symporter-like transporter